MTRRLLLEPPVVGQVATVIPITDLAALCGLADVIFTAASSGNLIGWVQGS